MRRHTIGGPLRDSRGARGRARAVRDTLRDDESGATAAGVMRAGLGADLAQLPLWLLPSDVIIDQGVEVLLSVNVGSQAPQVTLCRGLLHAPWSAPHP